MQDIYQVQHDYIHVVSSVHELLSVLDGGSLFDCRLKGPTIRFGPFDTVQDFHWHLRGGMEFDPSVDPDVQDYTKQQGNPLSLLLGVYDSLRSQSAKVVLDQRD